MRRETLEALVAARRERRAVVVLTALASGEQRLLDTPDAGDDPAIAAACATALRTDQARCIEHANGEFFIQPVNPPLRLAIVGAVHIGQHLAAMATRTGYDVTVIDPRSAFATEARFPGIALSHAWPDRALEALALDARTAVVTLTHDPKLDDPALGVALRSPAFYVGSLGSRRTQQRRAERMRALGLSEAEIARNHGPVGLAIGARSPAEIAVSVIAQITETLRGEAP